MKNSKKILSLLLVVILSFALASCGTSSEGEAEGNADQANSGENLDEANDNSSDQENDSAQGNNDNSEADNNADVDTDNDADSGSNDDSDADSDNDADVNSNDDADTGNDADDSNDNSDADSDSDTGSNDGADTDNDADDSNDDANNNSNASNNNSNNNNANNANNRGTGFTLTGNNNSKTDDTDKVSGYRLGKIIDFLEDNDNSNNNSTSADSKFNVGKVQKGGVGKVVGFVNNNDNDNNDNNNDADSNSDNANSVIAGIIKGKNKALEGKVKPFDPKVATLVKPLNGFTHDYEEYAKYTDTELLVRVPMKMRETPEEASLHVAINSRMSRGNLYSSIKDGKKRVEYISENGDTYYIVYKDGAVYRWENYGDELHIFDLERYHDYGEPLYVNYAGKRDLEASVIDYQGIPAILITYKHNDLTMIDVFSPDFNEYLNMGYIENHYTTSEYQFVRYNTAVALRDNYFNVPEDLTVVDHRD